MKFCVMCGQQLAENSKFCEHCGVKAEPEAREAVQEEAAALEQTVSEPIFQEEKLPKTSPQRRVSAKSRKKRESPYTHVAAVCASVLLFLILAVGIVIFTVRRSTTEEAVSAVVTEINIADIRVGDMMNADDSSLTLADYIHDNLDEELVSRYNLSAGNIEELLEEEDIKDFLSEKLSEYCDYIYSGGSAPKVTAKEITRLLESNENAVYKITGYRLSESDYQDIRDSLDEVQLEMLDMSNVSKEYSGVFTLLNIGLSYWLLALLAVMAVLLCVLIFMLYRRQIKSAFLCIGAAVLTVGLGEILAYIFSGNAVSVLCDTFRFPREAVKPIVHHVSANFIQTAVVISVSGIILIAVYIVLGKWHGLQKCEED